MRQKTYDRVENLYKNYHGYIGTKALLKEGFTNRQIAQLQEEGYLQKIANGSFWLIKCGLEKPADYKAVEMGMVNEKAVVIADSACFYQGLIDVEPVKLSIATRRSDRHQMRFPFAVTRHYFAENGYEEDMKKVETPFGNYQIYDIGRSVCDSIRFRESIDTAVFDLIIENYRKAGFDRQMKERLLAYAKRMKFEDRAKGIL